MESGGQHKNPFQYLWCSQTSEKFIDHDGLQEVGECFYHVAETKKEIFTFPKCNGPSFLWNAGIGGGGVSFEEFVGIWLNKI